MGQAPTRPRKRRKEQKQKKDRRSDLLLLGYLDSNQEKQDQNLLCYHYTIAQENNK
jgi:hypothetical protein